LREFSRAFSIFPISTERFARGYCCFIAHFETASDGKLRIHFGIRAARNAEKLNELSGGSAALALSDIARDRPAARRSWLVKLKTSSRGNIRVSR
jgi:hypothetical protein